jgi:hypothetical protein
VAILPAITDLGFVLENDYFIALAVFLHCGHHPRPVNEWLTHGDIIAIADKQHSVQFDIAALSRVQALDVYGLALGYFMLFTACFNYRVNIRPPN